MCLLRGLVVRAVFDVTVPMGSGLGAFKEIVKLSLRVILAHVCLFSERLLLAPRVILIFARS